MSHRILVVEDEPVLRMTFQQFLNEAGYAAAAAEDAPTARESLQREDFDIVVCDILLGYETGIDLLRWMDDHGIEAAVIMITGEPNVESAAEAVRLGAFDYLAKPVHREELLRVVRLAAERQDLSRERDRFAAEADRTRRRLETIFDSVGEGILMVDSELRIASVNRAARHMMGWLESPAGQGIASAIPMDWAVAIDALRRTVADGKTSGEERIEVKHAGSPSRVYLFSAEPLVKGEGALLVVRDITRLTDLESQLEVATGYQSIVGRNPGMLRVFELIEDLKETTTTVLICGESGTGKEGIAAAIQRSGPRKDAPYVRVNCAALPDDLLESELFGHVRGAFTGAVKDREGRFEAADGGTILLDEIGDVSPRLQLRLLRVLQEHEFERVGDSTPRKADVRVIATTNQDLQTKIDDGTFRTDLYYRLNVVRIDVPPLRERTDDVSLLANHFLARFTRLMRKDIYGISPEVMRLLLQYNWPGNVRELEHAIERACIVCRGEEILPEHLPREIAEPEVPRNTDTQRRPTPPAEETGRRTLSRDLVESTLDKTDWNIAKAAKRLGIARNTLYSRIRRFGLTRPDSLPD